MRFSTPARRLRSCPSTTRRRVGATPRGDGRVVRPRREDGRAWIGKFAKFAIGNEEIADVEIRVADIYQGATYRGRAAGSRRTSSATADVARRRLPARASDARRAQPAQALFHLRRRPRVRDGRAAGAPAGDKPKATSTAQRGRERAERPACAKRPKRERPLLWERLRAHHRHERTPILVIVDRQTREDRRERVEAAPLARAPAIEAGGTQLPTGARALRRAGAQHARPLSAISDSSKKSRCVVARQVEMKVAGGEGAQRARVAAIAAVRRDARRLARRARCNGASAGRKPSR